MYYDVGDRSIATVNVGTNGGSIWSRPSTIPTRSDTELVTSVTYDSAGRAFETTDPRGLVARTEYDDLGRTTKTIENYVDGIVGDDNDKTTEYTYGPAGMTSLTAKLTGGGGQTTEWVYGVGSGSGVVSNDIVGVTRWPDPTTGAASSGEQETVLVNALGQPLVTTDRNGNVHTLTYDILGRVVADAVTTLGSGVDGSVRRVETAYDSQGQAYLFTTFDAASGGNIVTQVQRQFNGLGQLTAEYQSHSGAVNTSTTPKVQYAYSELGSSENHSRLMSVTYPSGYVLTYNYFSGLNGTISRLSSLSDSTGTLESYDYLGLGTVVRRSHPQPDLDLTFLGTGPGSGGDQYMGLDSFGRVVDQHWKHGSTSTDRFTYTHDRNGNRLAKGNALNSNFSETYTYDGLNQLSSFARGNGDLQSWDFDSLGNWDSVTTNGTTQTRSANAQNEITSISGATTPTYDANGNMTTDETGKQFVYDAWNRLKIVQNSAGATLKTYLYDAMNRRVSEIVGSDTTELYYSAGWQVLEDRLNVSGKNCYVWSPVYVDAMVLRDRLDTSERLWVQQDANWNVTALVNASGVVVERYAYEPYGKVTVMNATWSTISGSTYDWQYLHQGGRLDTASGLYHFRNRDYSLSVSRWISADPITFKSGDANLFRYAANSPANYTDALGLAIHVEILAPSKGSSQGGISIMYSDNSPHNVRFLQFVKIDATISCQAYLTCKVKSWDIRMDHKHGDLTIRVGGGWQVDNGGRLDTPYYPSEDIVPVPGGSDRYRYVLRDFPRIHAEIKSELQPKLKDYERILEKRDPRGGKYSCWVSVKASFHTYVIVDGKVVAHIAWERSDDATQPKVIIEDTSDIPKDLRDIVNNNYQHTDPPLPPMR
jgi:RHS repeat-associated protein